jgi:hypothetical protein
MADDSNPDVTAHDPSEDGEAATDDAGPAGEDEPGSSADRTEQGSSTDRNEPESSDSEGAGDEPVGLVEARRLALDQASAVLDHPVDDVIEMAAADDGDGWRVSVEVLERSAVPDTQDILGRYELEVDASGRLTGYSLVDRYRRGELKGSGP